MGVGKLWVWSNSIAARGIHDLRRQDPACAAGGDCQGYYVLRQALGRARSPAETRALRHRYPVSAS
jgi:hypothetical protein